MRRIVLLSGIMLSFICCFAQEELPTIVADRPGVIWGTDVMPLHKVNWENGLAWERDYRGIEGSTTLTLDNTMLRYGLSENAELRLSTELLMSGHEGGFEPTVGFPDLVVGAKIKMYEGNGILPSIGLLAEMALPVGATEFRVAHTAPSLYLLFQNDISDRFSICYNVGGLWDGESAVPSAFAGISLGYSFLDNLSAYIENYNVFAKGEDPDCFLGLGLAWLVTRRLQLDLSSDFNLNDYNHYNLVSFGVAWMIN